MSSQQFTVDERTVEKEWQIYLNAIYPATVSTHGDALEGEDWSDDLNELDLIPESITLNSVSFYFTGTFEEAYTAARDMCDELNENRDVGDSKWEFERGSIMLVED
jgi:hypothetical protein